jgi:hypothetical protein
VSTQEQKAGEDRKQGGFKFQKMSLSNNFEKAWGFFLNSTVNILHALINIL